MQSPAKADILLVDDRPENLLALEAILEGLDQNLVRASSGEEALKQILSRDFAVILLDVQMPGMNGFETAEVIKGRDKSRHIPIIFLTALNKEEAYMFKGYSVGAVDYMSKPFDPDILRSKVAVFVELWHKTEQLKVQARRLREVERQEQQRRLAEQALSSEQRYRNLAEAIPQIVWTARPDGTPAYVNQHSVAYTGLSREETKKAGWRAFTHPEDMARFEDAWARARSTGEPFEVEVRLRRASDGACRWHWIQGTPERDAEGRVSMWLGTATDIDDRIRTAEELRSLTHALSLRNKEVEAEVALRTAELRRANEELLQVDRYKDEFLSVISHELRTPLNFIMGFASVLEDEIAGPLSDQQRDYLLRILNGADRMLLLVNDLLDFAKLQAGQFQLSCGETDYTGLMSEVVATVSPLAAQKRITLRAETPDQITALCDGQRITQVLINLLGNALKFTPEGGTVHLRVHVEGSVLVTEVEDSGVGIAEGDFDKLFTRFRQLDMSYTREAGGTGLGLSICKALVEAHGGTISALSPGVGQGATFRFTIPLAPGSARIESRQGVAAQLDS